MAKSAMDAVMEKALKAASDYWARSRLDANKQKVVVTRHNIRASFIESTNRYFERETTVNPLTDKDYNEIAAEALRGLKAGIEASKKCHLRKEQSNSNRIEFEQDRGVRLPFRRMKEFGQRKLKEKLRVETLDKDLIRDIDLGTQRLHRDTTVGLVRLAKVLDQVQNDEWFRTNGYLTTEAFKDIYDKYGDLLAKIEINPKAKARADQAKYKGTVAIDVARKGKNFAGSQANDWARLKPKLEESVSKWLSTLDLEEVPGSMSLREEIQNNAEANITDILLSVKGAKGKRKKKAKARTRKGDARGRNTTKSKTPSNKSAKKASKAVRSDFSMGAMLGALNQRINQKVEENMGSPRLTSRTGRFASSVRITDVTQTPKGFPSIGYTYMKSPYQTFEKGYARGSEDLDPRRLIEFSIRELAAEMALGRLYTRRV